MQTSFVLFIRQNVKPKHGSRFAAACLSVVGAGGLEPPTPASQTRCATGLRYAPYDECEYNSFKVDASRGHFYFAFAEDISVNPILPELYHFHHRPVRQDLQFWLDLARKNDEPALELGCGTGRVLFHLARKAVRVFGLDIDWDMLVYLRSRSTTDLLFVPPVFQGDMTAFHLALRFGLIYLPCNTYSTLNASQRRILLERISSHLKSGGLFAASQPNPALLAQMPTEGETELEEVFTLTDRNLHVQVSSAWMRTASLFHVWWHYDLLMPDGHVQRYTIQVIHHLDPAESIRDELAEAGFDHIEFFGNFSRSPYRQNSPYLILQAESE
jgi:SAM-dependent methyltransferase